MIALELTQEQLDAVLAKADRMEAYFDASVKKMGSLGFKVDDQLLEATQAVLAAMEVYRGAVQDLVRRKRYQATGSKKLQDRIHKREAMKAIGDDWPEFPDFK